MLPGVLFSVRGLDTLDQGRGVRFQFRLDFSPDGPGRVYAHHQGEGDHTPSSLKKVGWSQGPGMHKAI